MKLTLDDKVCQGLTHSIRIHNIHPRCLSYDRIWTSSNVLHGLMEVDSSSSFVDLIQGNIVFQIPSGYNTTDFIIRPDMTVELVVTQGLPTNNFAVDGKSHELFYKPVTDVCIAGVDTIIARKCSTIEAIILINYMNERRMNTSQILVDGLYTNMEVISAESHDMYTSGWQYVIDGERVVLTSLRYMAYPKIIYDASKAQYNMIKSMNIFEYNGQAYHYNITISENRLSIKITDIPTLNSIHVEFEYREPKTHFIKEPDIHYRQRDTILIRTNNGKYVEINMHSILDNLETYKIESLRLLNTFLNDDIISIIVEYMLIEITFIR